MEYIGKNEDLLQSVNNSILDSEINRFDIYSKDHRLFIDVYFLLPDYRPTGGETLKLHFIGVTEYEFYWNDQHRFYTVERYKFLKSEKGFYISLDPYDESEKILDNDHDIILSKEVEGWFL